VSCCGTRIILCRAKNESREEDFSDNNSDTNLNDSNSDTNLSLNPV